MKRVAVSHTWKSTHTNPNERATTLLQNILKI